MLDRNHAGLCLVDVQGRLALQMHQSDELIDRLKLLIRGAVLLGIPVIWLEQLPDKLGPTHPELAELLPGTPLSKSSFSGMQDDQIAQQIRASGRTQWLVAGIESHVCVYQTVRDLIREKFSVYLVGDCVASRNPENKRIAVQEMQQLGARLTSAEMSLFEMKQQAGDDEFRALIELIK